MTRKVFWENPYRATLDTRVATVAGSDLTLDATIFFALSGGQESDRGSIGGHEVLQARTEGAEIVYTLAERHGLRPGDAVRVAIDWERRYRLMRLHFAAEIVLELAYKRFGTGSKIGAHIAADKARIDFQWAEPLTRLLPELSREAIAVVGADAPIISAYSDAASERRYWEIQGFARVPCGGTHLRRAGEIGAIELKRKNIGKGKERIEIFVDDRPAPPPSMG